MTKRSLMDMYDDMDGQALMMALDYLKDDTAVFPLADLLELLEETSDLELTVFIVQLLMYRIKEIDDDLMLVYFPKSSDKVKQQIITIFATLAESKYMQFLLDEYFKNPYFRPAIRQQAFKDKMNLFMNLVRYYEDLPLTSDGVLVAQQILRMIPRDVVIKTGNVFTGTRLMDVYYAMPPEDRAN
ncbi:MAG: hypothetical protein ACON35_04255 [Candidatus Marinamargulisbacteria bacterium]